MMIGELMLFADEMVPTCLILGNGPSLSRSIDRIEELRADGAVVLGSNRVYLDGGVLPDYLMVIDHLVEAECRDELIDLADRVELVLDRDWIRRYPPDIAERAACYRSDRSWTAGRGGSEPGFWQVSDPDTIHDGGTVTYGLLQLAYLMGFDTAVLLGVDHRYRVPDRDTANEHGIVLSNGYDPNHFNPEYFGPGRHYHVPNVERMEAAYRKAKSVLDEAGMAVVNETSGSALLVFPTEAIYA